MGRRGEYPAVLCGGMAVCGFDCGGGIFVEEVSESGELTSVGVLGKNHFSIKVEIVNPNIHGFWMGPTG